MVRLSLSAIAVAAAAGRCVAEPMGEAEIQNFGAMGGNNQQEPVESYVNTMEDAPTPNTPKGPGNEMFAQLPKLVEKQLQLQETLMTQIIKDVDEYLKETTKAFSFENTPSTALSRVNEMMEKISTRMATALQGANELMASSEALDSETLRNATMKFMKEVRVQDIVVDALWASLRGTQTNAWVNGTAGIEAKDVCTAGKRAEEFLSRMYANLRAAGISEEDIVKFVPKPGMEGMQMRNMGKRGRGYGYGGYGYGYSYPSYYSYGYPSYYSYGYPSYYSYGYPSYYSYGYPYYSYGYPYAYGFRRLRPNCPGCPPAPVNDVPEVPFGVPPQKPVVPPFRSMGEETMGMGYNSLMGMGYGEPMMGYGMGGEYPAPYDQAMGYLMDNMYGMNGLETPYGGMPAGYRNLAPIDNMPGLFPESGMYSSSLGFGPIGGMPL